jgi:hypothetical protein
MQARKSFVLLALLAAAPATLLAQQEERVRRPETCRVVTTPDPVPIQSVQERKPPFLLEAGNESRVRVADKGDAEIGQIQEYLFSRHDGRLRFVVIRGIGGSQVQDRLVPYSSLDWDEDTRVLSLASSLGGLQEYPVFDREQLESVYAAEFSQASESAKGVGTMKQPRATGDGVLPRRPSPLFLSEEVLAAEVRARHQDLGHVNRLLFDPSRGRVVYALIQESAAPSEASLVVPWQALEMPATIDTDEIVFWLGLSAAELEDAPRLGEEGLESLEDPERVSAVHAFYGIPEFTPRACAERVD